MDNASYSDTDTSDLYQDLALTSGSEVKLPLMELAASEVCQGVAFRDASGKKQEGTKACGPFKPCSQSLRTDCKTTSDYQSIDKGRFSGEMIKSGKSFLGVKGTYTVKTYSACGSTNQSGCSSTTTYLPIRKTKLEPQNIKKDVPIASGLVGAFPSAAFPLVDAPAGAKSLATTGVAKAAANASDFYFWDHKGAVHTVNGDAGLNEQNILSDRTVYGIKGKGSNGNVRDCNKEGDVDCKAGSNWAALKESEIGPGDIRKDIDFGGISGTHPSASSRLLGASSMQDLNLDNFNQLQSGASIEFFDRNGKRHVVAGDTNLVAGNIKNGVTVLGVSGGYDGYDLSSLKHYDLRVGKPMPNATDGSTGKLDTAAYCLNRANCLGFHWTDLTATIANASGPCSASSETCAFRTSIQMIDWAFPLNVNPMTWLDAVRHCEELTLYGKDNWRMPTQKELMQSLVNSMAKLEIFDKAHFKKNGEAPKIWTSTAFYPKTTSGAEDRFIYKASTDGIAKAAASTLQNVACIRELEPAEAAEAAVAKPSPSN